MIIPFKVAHRIKGYTFKDTTSKDGDLHRNCFLKFYTSIDLIAYNLHDSVVKESCLKTADPEFKSAGGFCSCFRELCIFPQKCFPACLTDIIFMVHAIYHN